MIKRILPSVVLVGYALLCSLTVGWSQQTAVDSVGKLVIETRNDGRGRVSEGYYEVRENREDPESRRIKLRVRVFHALGNDPQPDPLFFLAGGPGQGAADVGGGFAESWIRTNRDIVLVNQRGTGGDNRLAISLFENPDDLQQYLGPLFEIEKVQQARNRLEKNFDLRMYSTPIAMDDLNDVRRELGYDKINLMGGSYGTRAALVYLRRHGDTVRTATLNGVAPIEFTNPLYHAESAQRALEMIFQEVEESPLYRKNFPGLREKFTDLMKQFDDGPIEVEVGSGANEQTVKLSKEAFVGALRFQMYYMDTSRKVPVLLWRAVNGNLRPFAESSIRRNRNLGRSIALGMLLSVTAAEDIARINPDDVEPACEGSFIGSQRVWSQMDAAKHWPKSTLPDNFGQPVVSEVPTLILSGTIDPVTPPKWGELVHRNFKNSLHIVAPAAHGVGGACIDRIQQQFLTSGSVADLDTACVEQMKMPPLYLPKENVQN